MTDQAIKELVTSYRSAIERARNDGVFAGDIRFDRFPTGCCGDTCHLLAEYLRHNGIVSIFYSAQRGDWSHAWLVVKDERVREPEQEVFCWPDEIKDIVASYGIEDPSQSLILQNYKSSDLKNGLIIDITADQFIDCNKSTYIGPVDAFHRSFHFINAHVIDSLPDIRLEKLYQTIENYLHIT